MSKIIRPTYPVGFSLGLLILIFVITFFLSHQIFEVRLHDLNDNIGVYFGMFLATCAVIIMILIIWEEFLFPIEIKSVNDGMIFRNHRNKLKIQLLIYCTIPAIFGFIYYEYEVNMFRFVIWATVCTVLPAVEKIFSGINNYNDFLKLTTKEISYKNNEKEGNFILTEVKKITVINDERRIIAKIQLHLNDNEKTIIDLDEMELDAFYDSISLFITTNYANLVHYTQMRTQN